MFEIKTDYLGDLEIIILTNQNTNEYVTIIPSFGGNICELVLKKGGVLYSIIDGDKSAKELIDNCCYRGAKLIPFPNRIKDGRYNFNGNTYQLPINHLQESHAIHGFIYDKPTNIIRSGASKQSAFIEMEYIYNGSVEGFPFSFTLIFKYILTVVGLDIETKVKNIGKGDMPFGDGWHPYFSLNEHVDDLFIRIPSTKKIVVDNRMIPAGELVNDDRFRELAQINNTFFDNGYLIEKQAKAITQLFSKNKNLTINIWQESHSDKYNYLQIYTPPSRKSIAIEPMTCSADAFNNYDGLIILAPEDEFRGLYGVYLS